MKVKITRERNKTQEKKLCKLKTIAHHQMTDAQPVPEPRPLGQLSP